jgi:tRNA pseudouridine32 synthase / 23S rRNA pseudouridine746 synthase
VMDRNASPHPAATLLASRAKSGDPPGEGKGITWLALEPLTGRTHQLRVHCAAMGWPIFGDAIYGRASRKDGPILHLHAREVVVPLYKNRAAIRVAAPIPAHMRAALTQCGWRDESQPRHSPPAFAREESQGVDS